MGGIVDVIAPGSGMVNRLLDRKSGQPGQVQRPQLHMSVLEQDKFFHMARGLPQSNDVRSPTNRFAQPAPIAPDPTIARQQMQRAQDQRNTQMQNQNQMQQRNMLASVYGNRPQYSPQQPAWARGGSSWGGGYGQGWGQQMSPYGGGYSPYQRQSAWGAPQQSNFGRGMSQFVNRYGGGAPGLFGSGVTANLQGRTPATSAADFYGSRMPARPQGGGLMSALQNDPGAMRGMLAQLLGRFGGF